MTITLPARPAARSLAASSSATPVLDLYARLSRNPLGKIERTDRQVAECREAAERMGITVGEVHIDPSFSAWNLKVRRPGWEALMARLESGAASGVIVWHVDRLFRQPRDLERLLVLRDSGVRLASVHGERNIADPDDVFILRIEVAHACRSSDDTSRRLRDQKDAARQDGRMNGGARAFGFPGADRTAPKNPATGERPAVADDVVARERDAIAAASADVVAGVTMARIVDRWNADGLLTATGSPWTHVAARAVLLRARNAGIIEHNGVEVSRSVEDPIIAEELYLRVRAKFSARRRGRPNSGRHLASGIVRCGVCGRTMGGRPHVGTYSDGEPRRQYGCRKSSGGCGGVSIDARAVDAELRAWTVRRLADHDHVARLTQAAQETASRLDAISAELLDIEQTQISLGEKLGRREMPYPAWEAANDHLSTRARVLSDERARLEQDTPPDDAGSGENAQAIAAEWDAPDTDTERRRTLLVTALHGYRVEIGPVETRGRGANPRDRVSIVGRVE